VRGRRPGRRGRDGRPPNIRSPDAGPVCYSCSRTPYRCRIKRHTTLPLIGSRRERFAGAA